MKAKKFVYRCIFIIVAAYLIGFFYFLYLFATQNSFKVLAIYPPVLFKIMFVIDELHGENLYTSNKYNFFTGFYELKHDGAAGDYAMTYVNDGNIIIHHDWNSYDTIVIKDANVLKTNTLECYLGSGETRGRIGCDLVPN